MELHRHRSFLECHAWLFHHLKLFQRHLPNFKVNTFYGSCLFWLKKSSTKIKSFFLQNATRFYFSFGSCQIEIKPFVQAGRSASVTPASLSFIFPLFFDFTEKTLRLTEAKIELKSSESNGKTIANVELNFDFSWSLETPFEYGLMLVFELAVVLSAKQFGKKLEVCCSNLIFANLYNFE